MQLIHEGEKPTDHLNQKIYKKLGAQIIQPYDSAFENEIIEKSIK